MGTTMLGVNHNLANVYHLSKLFIHCTLHTPGMRAPILSYHDFHYLPHNTILGNETQSATAVRG